MAMMKLIPKEGIILLTGWFAPTSAATVVTAPSAANSVAPADAEYEKSVPELAGQEVD